MGTSPEGLLHYAKEFMDAANVVADESVMASHTLIGHSIELGLKAFLLAKGIPMEQLKFKPYGHDLGYMLDAADALDLNSYVEFAADHRTAIGVLNDVYSTHGFRYYEPNTVPIPEWNTVNDVADRLVQRLREITQEASRTWNQEPA